MGEVKDDGTEKKKEGGGGQQKKDTEDKQRKKEDGGAATVVLKLDLHCEGCAKKVCRCATSFEGVEKVRAELESGKVTVFGKVDAWKLRDRLEVKTHKKVVLVSPTDPPKKKDEKEKEKEKGAKKAEKGKEVDVVLKMMLHCDGCIQKIRRTIVKFKGVVGVTIDSIKDQVIVRGSMDVNTMLPYLREKLRRGVELVAPKGGGEEKKGEKSGKEGEKKKDDGGGGGGGGGAEEKTKKKDGSGGEAKVDVNKLEHFCYHGGNGGAYAWGHNNYMLQMVQTPQMFSDENPNACSVM